MQGLAESIAERWLNDPDLGEHISLLGPSGNIAEGLQKYVDYGAKLLILRPIDQMHDQLEHLALVMGMRQEFDI